MFDSAQILGFVAAVAVLVIVPGPNTVLILTHSLAGGRRAGLATVLGVESGTVVHTAAVALGLSALLSTSALAFDAVKYVGAAYLTWLGIKVLRGGGETPAPCAGQRLRFAQAYARALLTNVLNPNVAVFFLAFLPQFVHPERGHVVVQIAILGALVSGVGLAFGSVLAVAAGSLDAWLRRGPIARWQPRLTGAVLVGLGVRLAWASVR